MLECLQHPSVLDEVRVDTLKSAPGSRKRHKRKGRGISAGQGASCGFGMRGQKSRSGPGVRAGFEGGQTPLHRRIPKLVGRPMGPGHTKKVGAACLVSLGKRNPSTYDFISCDTLVNLWVVWTFCICSDFIPILIINFQG